MRRRRIRNLFVKVLPVLLPVAIIGYLLGGSLPHSSSSREPSELAERALAGVDTVVLEYPASYGWLPSTEPIAIPGLKMEQTLVLSPGGDSAAKTGLLAGKVPKADPSSSLPASLFEANPQLSAKATVVSLLDTQAYRYTQAEGKRASGPRLVVYAIPYTADATTAIACYAPAGDSGSDLDTCERIAAQLTLQGAAQSAVLLTPDAGYSKGLHKLLDRMEGLRADARAALSKQTVQESFADAAANLARGFVEAKQSLMTLQPPAPAGTADTVLAAALDRSSHAYGLLAGAARQRSPAAFSAARSAVYEAEAGVGKALRDFALIGYD